MARLKERYQQEIAPALASERGITNKMAVPRLVSITVSVGLGRAIADSRWLEIATDNLAKITGQHPVITRAKKSVASFKLRTGMPIGARVTLRGERMYEFLDRLIEVALPRVRDFRGLETKGFDAQGNYNLGISEVSVFPEAAEIELSQVHGLQITFVTTAKDKEAGEALLRALGLPLKPSAGSPERSA
jgi:large subunit ribosomal protein L5